MLIGQKVVGKPRNIYTDQEKLNKKKDLVLKAKYTATQAVRYPDG